MFLPGVSPVLDDIIPRIRAMSETRQVFRDISPHETVTPQPLCGPFVVAYATGRDEFPRVHSGDSRQIAVVEQGTAATALPESIEPRVERIPVGPAASSQSTTTCEPGGGGLAACAATGLAGHEDGENAARNY
jgi:hypothetical protein